MRVNWKRLLLVVLIVILLILLLRGCVSACSDKGRRFADRPGTLRVEVGDQSPTIEVFLHEEDKREEMTVEQYLVGVVAAEMPASFEKEALKAQAVAARTYSLRQIQAGGCASGCDICSNSGCCQAYDTLEACKEKWGSNYEANLAKIQSAVRETYREALYYDGELIEALYHSSSGGQTENSENVFAAARPYLQSVSSDYEVGARYMTDEKRYTKESFAKSVNAAFSKAKVKAGKLKQQVKILSSYASGRVKDVQLGEATVTGRELRTALSLRSTWFTIDLEGDEVVVRTRGYGHGVGMSQAGANGMAQEGADYTEILAHYYINTTVKDAY